MRMKEIHKAGTDWLYKFYKNNKTILVWRKAMYNYGYGFYAILPYSKEHRKIKTIKDFNKTWNLLKESQLNALDSYSYNLSHKAFEEYIKKEVIICQ